MFLLLMNLGWSAPPEDPSVVKADAEIVVTGSRYTEVYVAPTKIVTNGDSVDIDTGAAFSYAHSHKHLAEYKGDYGYYSMGDEIDVYSSETISFIYEDCKWKATPKKCSFQNSMWLLESVITIGKEHATLRLTLYDENMSVLSTVVRSNTKVVNYIERKKTSKIPVTVPGGVISGGNCAGPTCSRPIATGPQTRIATEEEELPPAKITIPAKLLNKDFHQASMMLWLGVKLK